MVPKRWGTSKNSVKNRCKDNKIKDTIAENDSRTHTKQSTDTDKKKPRLENTVKTVDTQKMTPAPLSRWPAGLAAGWGTKKSVKKMRKDK